MEVSCWDVSIQSSHRLVDYWRFLVADWRFLREDAGISVLALLRLSWAVKKQLWNQGSGRHTASEIETLLHEDLKALSAYLSVLLSVSVVS